MAKSSGPTISVAPKNRCCRSRKRCKRCPVVLKRARTALVRDGVDVGANPRVIQLTVAPDKRKKMRKQLERAITQARKEAPQIRR